MPSSVRAHTTATSAMEPLVIQVFSPLSTQSEPSLRALVRIPAGFDPKSGSVSPKQPIASPLCNRGSHRCLLLLRPVGQDRIHHQRALHADEAAEAGIAALQFLHDQAVLDVVHARAAIAFQIRAEESQPAHLRNQFGGEARVAEAIADQRQNPLVGKLARGLPHQQFLLTEQRIDAQIIHAGKGRHRPPFYPAGRGRLLLLAPLLLVDQNAAVESGELDLGAAAVDGAFDVAVSATAAALLGGLQPFRRALFRLFDTFFLGGG